MPDFDTLDYWLDECPRRGVENMAVDQLLMEALGERPLLRVYGWSAPTISLGYFLPLSDAITAFPGEDLTYVRRWTGGGVVDHRIDITYTVLVPRSHPLSMARGAESYRIIHQALANVLGAMGEKSRLTVVDEGDGGSVCFSNPVAYDLTGEGGRKIAGAGQRRTKHGLLHQGSVVADVGVSELGKNLALELTTKVEGYIPPQSLLANSLTLAETRYESAEWLNKNP